ncbi:hypothetical protein OEA41_007245 [Lepraria neglecta]|uniref:RING-type domain-containing protein n=1 Tax=Lepraria neglecta TaxID=209136 RepID=A0AAD9ZCF5_9LECA|nr:hypothetical protein OEA41_007245 [Lepraria neglecta]
MGLFPDKPTCKLCLWDFSEANGKVVRQLPCGHIFHLACVDVQLDEPELKGPSCLDLTPDDWYVKLPLIYEDDEIAKKDILWPPAGTDDRDVIVDIVFVHGLGGSRYGTWTKDNVLWPRELLAKDYPRARIMSVRETVIATVV